MFQMKAALVSNLVPPKDLDSLYLDCMSLLTVARVTPPFARRVHLLIHTYSQNTRIIDKMQTTNILKAYNRQFTE